MDIVEELRHDYCNCLNSYKMLERIDPQCESCNTKDERHRAADEIESLRQQLAEANAKVANLTARLERSEEQNKMFLSRLRELGDAN